MEHLAKILRPSTFEDFLGQEHLVGDEGVFRKFLKTGTFPNAILYGPPGCGKTTLIRIISSMLNLPFFQLNATTIKVDEIRKSASANTLFKPLVFIDEVHRLSKNQQEVLLPLIEEGQIIFVGASTENPYFALTRALRSRTLLFEFKKLTFKNLQDILDSALERLNLRLDKESKEFLITSSNGDARAMLNLLEFGAKIDKEPKLAHFKRIRPFSLSEGSSEDDIHYDLTSAMIKSIRGSDENGSIYYLARLIECEENPEFIARRLVILASEDIGLANPNALNIATSCMLAVAKIGYPEASIILSECVLYLAVSPKSNTSYKAIKEGISRIKNGEIYEIPKNITQFNDGYLYPHDFGGWVEQHYVDERFKVVNFSDIGFEKKIKEWLLRLKEKREENL